MKKYLIIALLGVASVVNATSYNLFSSVNCYNNSYSCNLPVSAVPSGQQISTCTFTFNSLSAYQSGLLYCNLLGNGSTCNVGSKGSSATTWNCTLTSVGLTYLNDCLSKGKTCNFGISCSGGWNIGNCSVNYTCTPTPHTTSVPDVASTAALLAFGLLGVCVLRRKLVLASAKK